MKYKFSSITLLVIIISTITILCGFTVSGINIDLPAVFLPYYFNTFPNVAKECSDDPDCPYKMHLDKNVCWGYEDNCVGGPSKPYRYSHPICDGSSNGWASSKKEQVDSFFKQADFGYVRNFRNSMKMICEPNTLEDSSLECSEYLTFCRARNIMIDFRRLVNRTEPVMYDMDVLTAGEIGGHCKLNQPLLKSQIEQISTLQSWAPELQHFTELNARPFDQDSKLCDRIVKTPTFIMKIDATVNMYHHFCDFFNLYASLFVNQTDRNPDMFTKNVRIAIWRTFKYSSSFEATFRAFSSFPILDLNDFKGKRVCFANAVFPLLPRMIFGLFYNTPLIPGCRDSGLFNSFSKFILHRLRIDLKPKLDLKKIKVTYISRLTTFRRVLNEDDILEELEKNENLIVNKVQFTWKTDFVEQLSIIQNTDILIGMHGAGLTHMMFLPEWAAVFELYNCGDVNCYADLARLRGLKYITWRNKDLLQEEDDIKSEENQNGPGHEKQRNYLFHTEEFVRLVNEAVNHLKDYAKKESVHDEL